ncbi:MAG: hypothetical protein E6Q97_34855 [Desulfurellales bacterium]|nr:MAG: hypothetical protein E6Q97_34855 [Desulfurellales bacterium]
MAPLRGPGKIAKDWTLGPVRELTRPDLELLKEKRAAIPTIQSIKDSHHRVARLCAMGLRTGDIVEQSGYGYGRLSVLRKDPAFLDLVESYRREINASAREQVDEYHAMLVENMVRAERMLADKLEEAEAEGSTLPTRDLIAIARDAADRTGYGKKNTTVNVNVDFAAKLEAARQRSARVITVARAPESAPAVIPPGLPVGADEPQEQTTPVPVARSVRRV